MGKSGNFELPKRTVDNPDLIPPGRASSSWCRTNVGTTISCFNLRSSSDCHHPGHSSHFSVLSCSLSTVVI